MNRVAWIKYAEITADIVGTASFKLYTDLPGEAVALRVTESIGPTVGKQSVRVRLPGTTKGRLVKASIEPTVFAGMYVRLYSVRLWARVLPGNWGWMNLPVIETPAEFQPVKLPIPVTPEEWSAVKLPMDASDPLARWVDIPTEGARS